VLIYGTVLCSVTPSYAQYCDGLPLAFVTDPVRIIAAWEGGMSFHGGLLGAVIAVWLFSRRHKVSMLSVSDLTCAFAPITIFLVRIANFVNDELWGRVTDVPWAMVFPRGGPLPRHPSQLYEAALEGLVLFLVLRLLFTRTGLRFRPGALCGCFWIGYGLSRIFVEFFREPDEFLGFLWMGASMGQLLSIPMVLFGVWLLARALKRPAVPHHAQPA
jgi:phosphatidylglycerol:prolipoprotein diacylglycerol transferase